MGYIFTSQVFIDKLKMAENSKTIYIKGCFGAPMTPTNKKRYTANLPYNKNRSAMINSCTPDTFGFDCVCLIKGILWGWNGDTNKVYGGAVYKANGVPDMGADSLMAYCTEVSNDFNYILPGEALWMPGHVGVYIGEGKVIECTPKWTNDVQYSNLGNLGYKNGNWRVWNKHGKLPWIDYSEAKPNRPSIEDGPVYYTVVKGDSLSKIGKMYGIKWQNIATLNNIKFPYIIRIGQKIRIK